MLPIPISPTPIRSTWSFSLPRPADSHKGSLLGLFHGHRGMDTIFLFHLLHRRRELGQLYGHTIPRSATTTSQRKYFAMADIPVRCLVMFAACNRVTYWGVQDTPSAVTPLSAHKTMMPYSEFRFFTFPVMPERRTEMSSSMPRLPGGLARIA